MRAAPQLCPVPARVPAVSATCPCQPAPAAGKRGRRSGAGLPAAGAGSRLPARDLPPASPPSSCCTGAGRATECRRDMRSPRAGRFGALPGAGLLERGAARLGASGRGAAPSGGWCRVQRQHRGRPQQQRRQRQLAGCPEVGRSAARPRPAAVVHFWVQRRRRWAGRPIFLLPRCGAGGRPATALLAVLPQELAGV